VRADKLTVNGLFDPNERREAPLFQRPYVWNQEANWEPLWESIKALATKRLTDTRVHPHFLGTVVLDQLRTPAGKLHARQLIDGQQRLTTLQIALAAARDLSLELSESKYAASFKGLTDNHVPLSDDPDDIFKVWPTNADRGEFRNVMTAGSRSAVRELILDGDCLIRDAYLYFADCFASWLEEDAGQRPQRLQALHIALREDLNVVVIDLEDNDDAQEIFETLNALGTPLLPADLVKNYLFRLAELQGDDTQKLYDQYWKGFDDDKSYWRKEVRQGRLRRARLDLFLNHYLTMMKGDEVIISQMFLDYKELVSSRNGAHAQEHLQDFDSYAEVYESFDRFAEDSLEGVFFHRLDEMDTTTVFPLLLQVFKKHPSPNGQSEHNRVLGDLESFLVRRAVCGLTSKNYNRFFAQLVADLHASGSAFSAADVRARLVSETADTQRWPSDDEFRQAWTTIEFYKRLKKSVQRMIFEAIEAALHTGKTEKVKIEKKLTLEHLLPRDWEAHWPLVVREQSSEAHDQALQRRTQSVHRVGNLTLLTKELNPSVSNGPWSKKRDKILEHSALNLNRPFKDHSVWDEDLIEERSKTLFNIAVKIWPHP
jgi:Protein of unknown function DUF262/Protein of unknown function (DUF1524)